MKFTITQDYIDIGNARPGTPLQQVKFIVSHDTGNPGSTAYANRNYFNNMQPSASAHTFIDDQYILEIIPLDEKAWHVRYNVPVDDQMFNDDANDAAIGVELAYGGKINFDEAYKRYVWYHAYLVDKYNLNPFEDIVSHSKLDPTRRTDPEGVLHAHGVSWETFIEDVNEAYYVYFKGEEANAPVVKGVSVDLPLRKGDKGAFIKEIQQKLQLAGFNLPRYGADGIYGEETMRAVMRFQKKYGLLVDGLAGIRTINKLSEVIIAAEPIDEFPLPDGILNQGDEGDKVKQLQRALQELNFNPQGVDGIYGPLTEDAVRRFQSMYPVLKNDGIYGPNTKRYMEMALEDLV